MIVTTSSERFPPIPHRPHVGDVWELYDGATVHWNGMSMAQARCYKQCAVEPTMVEGVTPAGLWALSSGGARRKTPRRARYGRAMAEDPLQVLGSYGYPPKNKEKGESE